MSTKGSKTCTAIESDRNTRDVAENLPLPVASESKRHPKVLCPVLCPPYACAMRESTSGRLTEPVRFTSMVVCCASQGAMTPFTAD